MPRRKRISKADDGGIPLDLPPEIWDSIARFLDAKSLWRFARVCKYFHNVFSPCPPSLVFDANQLSLQCKRFKITDFGPYMPAHLNTRIVEPRALYKLFRLWLRFGAKTKCVKVTLLGVENRLILLDPDLAKCLCMLTNIHSYSFIYCILQIPECFIGIGQPGVTSLIEVHYRHCEVVKRDRVYFHNPYWYYYSRVQAQSLVTAIGHFWLLRAYLMVNRKLAERSLNYPAFTFASHDDDNGWQMFSNTDLDKILTPAWKQPIDKIENIFDFKKNFFCVAQNL